MGVSTDTSRNLLGRILDFYLFSNLHISVCAVALVGVTQRFFNFNLPFGLYVFVFSGTFFLYNLQRLPAAFEQVEIERKFRRHRWNTQKRKLLLAVSAIAFITSSWAFLELDRLTQMLAVIPAFLSVAYAFPFVYWKKRWFRLREIPAIKIFIVGIVWGMSCVWLPAAADHSYPAWTSADVSLWTVACSIMIISITIPFDIRDLYYDGDRLKTLPAIFGVRQSIGIGVAGMIVSLAIVYYADSISPVMKFHHVIIYGIWTVITIIVIAFSKPERHEYYYSFLVDGLLIALWAMLNWM